ncbi:MAG: helix-turn-helix transcriptional regulator [Betaproteobacteria bacterium]
MDELQIEAVLFNGAHWPGRVPGPLPRVDGHPRFDASLQSLFLQTLAETLARARQLHDRHAPTPAPALPARALALARHPRPALSARETEVMECVAAGDSNKAIARALDLSVHTIKRHVANILDKFDARSRGEAAARWHAAVAAAGQDRRVGTSP